jgi:hypothetical protein
LILVPSLLIAIFSTIRAIKCEKPLSTASFNIAVLTVFAIAAFFMSHLVLRWQSLGVLRLMFPFVILAAPLTALILHKRPMRCVALCLLIATSGILSIFWLGAIARRLDIADRAGFDKIARLQNDHSFTLRYQWAKEPPREQRIREGYSNREVHKLILNGVQQPATLGVIGHGNTESIFLFGERFQNRIIPLVDCRHEDVILNRGADDIDYIISVDKFPESKIWADARGFEQIFSATRENEEVALVFKRRAQSP